MREGQREGRGGGGVGGDGWREIDGRLDEGRREDKLKCYDYDPLIS